MTFRYTSQTLPESVNATWRSRGKRVYLTPKARKWREQVRSTWGETLTGQFRFSMTVCPRDKRVRDLDNLFKSAIDSLPVDNDKNILEIVGRKCMCRGCPYAFEMALETLNVDL